MPQFSQCCGNILFNELFLSLICHPVFKKKLYFHGCEASYYFLHVSYPLFFFYLQLSLVVPQSFLCHSHKPELDISKQAYKKHAFQMWHQYICVCVHVCVHVCVIPLPTIFFLWRGLFFFTCVGFYPRISHFRVYIDISFLQIV